jgi:ribonuclease HI
MKVFLYTDGGSRGNPGPAGSAWIATENGKIIFTGAKRIGRQTNNIAEYSALGYALKDLAAWFDRQPWLNTAAVELTCTSDSALLINQMAGKWRIKNPTIRQIKRTLDKMLKEKGYRVKFEQVPRDNPRISQVDCLYNAVMDLPRRYDNALKQ